MRSSESTALPLPLPADVDVSDMPHIPLYDERLMKSRAWLRAKHWREAGPGIGFCLINLWANAFRSVPAGSLEDDEDVLADAAHCDIDYWREIKDKALTGWELIGGRWHHPVVSDIAWTLWRGRLEKRHENAIDSWRMQAKRRADKGFEPPDPPGSFVEWMARKYPATAHYISVLSERENARVGVCLEQANGHDAVFSERALNMSPKRSKGKESPPLAPPLPPVACVAPSVGPEKGGKPAPKPPDGKRWFARETARLCNEFGRMAPLMRSHLQRPGVGGDVAFVQAFKGAWLDPGGPSGPAIVMPTKRRADAVWADHSEWIRATWPQLRVRYATVDELRAFQARSVA